MRFALDTYPWNLYITGQINIHINKLGSIDNSMLCNTVSSLLVYLEHTQLDSKLINTGNRFDPQPSRGINSRISTQIISCICIYIRNKLFSCFVFSCKRHPMCLSCQWPLYWQLYWPFLCPLYNWFFSDLRQECYVLYTTK